MDSINVRMIQANLHHAKGASAVFGRRFVREKLDVGLIQEPWSNNGKVFGLPNQSFKLFYDNSHCRPRTAVLVRKDAKCIALTEFVSKDIVAIRMEVPTTRGNKEVFIASAYFPGDVDDIPPPEVVKFIAFCKRQNKQFIIGCDANAHHTVWSSTNVNSRGEKLLNYISCNNVDICNRGNSPTFVNSIRQEVLDLTLCSQPLSDNIKNWHVSDEESLSDHKHIKFDYNAGKLLTESFRDPRKTNWDLYRFHLTNEIIDTEDELNTVDKLENASNTIIEKVVHSYNVSCHPRSRTSNRDVPWWNDKLTDLRKKTRKLFNKVKINSNWDKYRKALTEYNKEIRRSRRRDWRHSCENIENTPTVARLHKALSKDHSNGLGNLKKNDGNYTVSSAETLEIMMGTHFPGSTPVSSGNAQVLQEKGPSYQWSDNSYQKACEIFTESRVEWAVSSFQPYKSAGMDSIFPAQLQQGKDMLISPLTKIFRSSLALGYIPKAWRQVRVIFVPKAGKRDKMSPKAFRPISLSSLFLKTMEKILDDYIKSTFLLESPLSNSQFAYQTGKSTVTALHSLVNKIEKSLQAKEICLVAFLDIEGAFDNASHCSIRRAMESKCFDKCIIEWIVNMLAGREISADHGGTRLTVNTVKGCPQGGVLSPLLWSLVVDVLLKRLAELGFEVTGYADDLSVMIRGKYDSVISSRMQNALNYIAKWCRNEGLNVNPAKTVLVPFTNRRKVSLTKPIINGISIEFSSEVKYLGVILDRRLNWNSHLEQAITKATHALWICKRTMGKKWGLKPKLIHWIYLAIIRPKISYASLVWWPKTKELVAQKKLGKLQRLACVATTGAMQSTPTNALDALLNMLPLHIFVQLEAEKGALYLKRRKTFLQGDLVGHLSILTEFDSEIKVDTIEDWMETKPNFDILYKVVLPSRLMWETGGPSLPPGAVVFYTDGSKIGHSTGAGVYGPGLSLSIPMGHGPTVFQAEVYAILKCINECLKRNYRHAKLCILSDSQAALNAIKAFKCQSKLVWECIRALQQLAARNEVILYWTPGHCGIEGNELADSLARYGSETNFIGPEPFLGLPDCNFKLKIKRWTQMKVESLWNASKTARQAKKFITPTAKNAQRFLNLNKNQLRVLTGLFTGHCPSRYHLSKLGKSDSSACRFCNAQTETSEHLLCECVKLYRQRLAILGSGFMQPADVWNLKPSKVLDFIYKIEPKWDCVQNQITAVSTQLSRAN